MTAAWFLTKRTVTATAGQFQAFKENGVIDRVEIYQEAGNQDTGTPYIFNSTPSYTHYFDNDGQDEGSMPNRFVYDGRRQNSNATRLYLFHVRDEKKDEAELKRSIESLTNESQEPGKGGNGTNGSLVLLKSVSSSDAKSSSKIQPANPISSQAGQNSQSSVLSYQIKTFDSSPINSSMETTDRKNVFDSVDSVSFVNQVNKGKFALGSVSGKDKNGAYLRYLDIGAGNKDDNNITIEEHTEIEVKTYSYPYGVEFHSFTSSATVQDSYSDIEGGKSSAVRISSVSGNGTEFQFSYSSSDRSMVLKVTGPPSSCKGIYLSPGVLLKNDGSDLDVVESDTTHSSHR